MFFRKKKTEEEQKDPITRRGIKKMDAVVTGGILAGIIASIYGVKKIRDHQKKDEHTSDEHHPHPPAH